jgi:hypothetical protein
MAGEPNELPEGGEGGGGGFTWGGWRGEWPAELPVVYRREQAVAGLLREVLAVRARLTRLENAQIAASVMGGGGGAMMMAAFDVGGPNELPEGGEGGGGGGGGIGSWGGWRGEFPQEIPVDRTILQMVAELEARFSAFEGRVVAALEQLEAQVQKLSG